MKLETALLIVPPNKVQAFAYPLREQYDQESFQRVPAHITLLSPFIPPDRIESAEAKLREICAAMPPFEVTLDRYGRFENAVFLEASNPEPILALFSKLTTAFPEYPAYGGEHGSELHPHLTLARFENPAEGDRIDLPPAPKFTFQVQTIHLYLGDTDADEPFIPRAVIPLSGAE